MKLTHTTVIVDNKCLDLLLTEDEIVAALNRAVDPKNHNLIDMNKCCSCWSLKEPIPCCPFWKKVFGLCEHCEDNIDHYSNEDCNE